MTAAAYNTNRDNNPCAQCDFKRYFGPAITVLVHSEGQAAPRELQLKYEGWQKLAVNTSSTHQRQWWISRNISRLIREVGADGSRGQWGHMMYAWPKTRVASNMHGDADSWYHPDAGWDRAYFDQWARLVALVNVRWTEDLDGDLHRHIAEFIGERLVRVEITHVSSAGMTRCAHQS